jgi:hypothetical protein
MKDFIFSRLNDLHILPARNWHAGCLFNCADIFKIKIDKNIVAVLKAIGFLKRTIDYDKKRQL